MDKGARKREEIRQATIKLIGRKGYNNVKITEVAKATKTSIGGMYHHYKSIEDIMLDIVESMKDKNIEVLFSAKEPEAIKKNFSLFLTQMKKDLLYPNTSVASIAYSYYSGLPEVERQTKLAAKYEESNEILTDLLGDIFPMQQQLDAFINNFFVVILGLQVLSFTGKLSEQVIDERFDSVLNLF